MLSLLSVYSLLALGTTLRASAHAIDQKCGPGLTSGFHITNLQYDIPTTPFIDRTKSFFDYEWCLGTNITDTTGEPTFPGATRAGFWPEVLGGHPFSGEELKHYDIGPDNSYLSMGWIWIPRPEPDIFPVGLPIRLGEYYQRLMIASICQGTATYLQFITIYCSDQPDAIQDILKSTDATIYGAMADEFGAKAFEGNCEKIEPAQSTEKAYATHTGDEL